MRGYPKGLRAGSNPRKPIISVDEYFEKIDCHGISSVLESIEVLFLVFKTIYWNDRYVDFFFFFDNPLCKR